VTVGVEFGSYLVRV